MARSCGLRVTPRFRSRVVIFLRRCRHDGANFINSWSWGKSKLFRRARVLIMFFYVIIFAKVGRTPAPTLR